MMGGPGRLLTKPKSAYLNFTGEMMNAFTVLTDSMYKKGDARLISHGKCNKSYREAADELKQARSFEATEYNTSVAQKVKQDLTATVAPSTPPELAGPMKGMVEICSNYLAQIAEFNKDKGAAFNVLVKQMKAKGSEVLYSKGASRRTYATAAKDLEESKNGLDTDHDDPVLTGEIRSKLSNIVEKVTPANMKEEMKDTLDVSSKYLSERAVDEIERGPCFELLIKELESHGGEPFAPDIKHLATKSQTAYVLKNAPGLSTNNPDLQTAPRFADLLHKVVDLATPAQQKNDMSGVINRCANYLSSFARDRDKALQVLLNMMKTKGSQELVKRNQYTMTYQAGAAEVESAPKLVAYLPVKDIADEIKGKLTTDMQNSTPPEIKDAVKSSIKDVSKYLSQRVALESGVAGDRYALNLMNAVEKAVGKQPLYKYMGYGQTHADGADELTYAGTLGKHTSADNLYQDIHSELNRTVPDHLGPMSERLQGTMQEASSHLAKVGKEKGQAMGELVKLMKAKGDEPLGTLQGYEQSYSHAAKRLEAATTLTNDKVDKGAYEAVRSKLTGLTEGADTGVDKAHMTGIIDDSSKYLASPKPESEKEKRQMLADLMNINGDEILGEHKKYQMSYSQGGEEIKQAPTGMTTSKDAAKQQDITNKINAALPNKKVQEILKTPVIEGSAHVTNLIKERGDAGHVGSGGFGPGGVGPGGATGTSKSAGAVGSMTAGGGGFGLGGQVFYGADGKPLDEAAIKRILASGGILYGADGKPIDEATRKRLLAEVASGGGAGGIGVMYGPDGKPLDEATMKRILASGGVLYGADGKPIDEATRKGLLAEAASGGGAGTAVMYGADGKPINEATKKSLLAEGASGRGAGVGVMYGADGKPLDEATMKRILASGGVMYGADGKPIDEATRNRLLAEVASDGGAGGIGVMYGADGKPLDEAAMKRILASGGVLYGADGKPIDEATRKRLLAEGTSGGGAGVGVMYGADGKPLDEAAMKRILVSGGVLYGADGKPIDEATRKRLLAEVASGGGTGVGVMYGADGKPIDEATRKRLLAEGASVGGAGIGVMYGADGKPLDEAAIKRILASGGVMYGADGKPIDEATKKRLAEVASGRGAGVGVMYGADGKPLDEATMKRILASGGVVYGADGKPIDEATRKRLLAEVASGGVAGVGVMYGADGKPLDEATIRRILASGGVLYGADGKPIDEATRKRLAAQLARRDEGGLPGQEGYDESDPDRAAALGVLHSELRAKGTAILVKQSLTELTHSEASDWLKKSPTKVDKAVKESGDTGRLHKKFERKLGALVEKKAARMQDAMQDVVIESARILSEMFVAKNYKTLVKNGVISEMQKKGNEILVEIDGTPETFFFAAQRLKKAKSLTTNEPCDQAFYYLSKQLDDMIRGHPMPRRVVPTMKEHVKEAATYLSEHVTKPDPQIEAYVALLGEMEATGDALLIEGEIPKSYKDAASYLRQLTSFEDQINRSNSSLHSTVVSGLKNIMANVPALGYKQSDLDDVIKDSAKLLVSYIMLQVERTKAMKILIDKLDEANGQVLLRHGSIRKSHKDGADLLRKKNADEIIGFTADPVVTRKVEIKLFNLMSGTSPGKFEDLMDDVIEDATMYLGVHLLQARTVQVCKCMKHVFVQCELWCEEILRRVARPCCTCSRHVSAPALSDLAPADRLQVSPRNTRVFAPGLEISFTRCPAREPCPARPNCPAHSPERDRVVPTYTMQVSCRRPLGLASATLPSSPTRHSSPAPRGHYSTSPSPPSPQSLSSQSSCTLRTSSPISPTSDLNPSCPISPTSVLSPLSPSRPLSPSSPSRPLSPSLRPLSPLSPLSPSSQLSPSCSGTVSSCLEPPLAEPESSPGPSTRHSPRSKPWAQSPASTRTQSPSRSACSTRTPIISTDQMSDWHAMMVSLMWNVQAWRDWIQENIDRALAYEPDPNLVITPEEASEKWLNFQRKVTTEALQWRQYNLFSQQLTMRLVVRYKGKRIVSPTRASNKTKPYHECQQEMLAIIEMFNRWTLWLIAVVKETNNLSRVVGSETQLHDLRWQFFKMRIKEYSDDWVKYNTHLKVCWEHKYRSLVSDWLPAWKQPAPVWVVSACGAVPSGAVAAGVYNSEIVWVARTTHRCSVMPAALHPSKHCCIVYADGGVHHYTKYQVMCNAEARWVRWRSCAGGARAVRVAPGLHVGRVLFRGSHLIGAVRAPRYRCHVVMFGRSYAVNSYELLVLDEDHHQ